MSIHKWEGDNFFPTLFSTSIFSLPQVLEQTFFPVMRLGVMRVHLKGTSDCISQESFGRRSNGSNDQVTLDGNAKALLLRHILTWMHGCLCKAHSFFFSLSLSFSQCLVINGHPSKKWSLISSYAYAFAIVSFTFILSHTHTHTVVSHFTFYHCQVNHQRQFKSIVVLLSSSVQYD